MSSGAYALIGTAVGALITASLSWTGIRLAREQWRTDALLRAMGHMTGGTQARNVGISMVDAMVTTKQLPPNTATVVTGALWNQLIYLCETDGGAKLEREHEADNARRMLRLVDSLVSSRSVSAPNVDAAFDHRRARLAAEIGRHTS